MPKLTPRLIKKLPPPSGSGAREVADTFPGLVLVIQHSGSMSWTFRYRVRDGSQRRYTLGKYPGLSPDAARGRASDLMKQVASGEDPQSEKAAARHAEVVDAFPSLAERFVVQHCKSRNRTWRDQGRVLGFKLAPLEARRPDLP